MQIQKIQNQKVYRYRNTKSEYNTKIQNQNTKIQNLKDYKYRNAKSKIFQIQKYKI